MADNVLFYNPLLVNTETNKVSLEKEMVYFPSLPNDPHRPFDSLKPLVRSVPGKISFWNKSICGISMFFLFLHIWALLTIVK